RVFLRTVQPSPEELKTIEGLSKDDPKVVDFDNRWWANKLAFFLCRIAVDDFGEIVILAGNAKGVGAYKILRGMYERIVTASYLSQNPSQVDLFIDDLVLKNWKLWKSSCEVIPEIAETVPKEEQQMFEAMYREAKSKHDESFCKKCRQPIVAEAWTRV